MGGICTTHQSVFQESERNLPVILHAGDFFGEEALLHGTPYPRSIVARGHVSLLVLSNSVFKRLCNIDEVKEVQGQGFSQFIVLNLCLSSLENALMYRQERHHS